MRLSDVFVCTPILDGGPALDKAALIDQLVTLLARQGHIPEADVPAISAAVLRRETLGTTGIGQGLAVPHANHGAVSRAVGALAVIRPPVAFDSLDREPVDVVALILAPPDRPGEDHRRRVRLGEALLRRLSDPVFCRWLRRAASPEEIAERLRAE